MNDILLITTIAIFLSSFVSLFVFRKVAKIINLVDVPTNRKAHQGEIPLVGGLAIFIVVLSFVAISPSALTSSSVYVFCALALLALGVLDDYFDVSFKLRLIVQLLMTFAMMYLADLQLTALPNVFGPFDIQLGLFGAILTVIAVIGAVNCFNMIDGIDGLLGGIATVTFGSMCLLFYIAGDVDSGLLCLVIVAATIPYILMNLGVPLGQRFKVFMGDAGSTVIGFTVVWMLIEGSQGNDIAFSPVTGLWVAAVPIMDAISTICRRIKKGQSPFKPDREHLHHILMRLGLSPKHALIAICLFALLLASFGISAEVLEIPHYVMFWLFVVATCTYYYFMSHIWRITVRIRKYFNITTKYR
ncbi:UDP-GlcNAc:undecaprenyl-phosphate GlcNAc-1-phosphate transferase [Pseudoalteromonas citrea]|uniref:Undecaprenyl-phosphate alpha-N-acetylglucosaminyl 1-phosphate transferase n=2 Tax=Pseudoalteromonas citrea TaxID=43655 RepID=A0AAD4AMI7_9GAMM|nr:UDP-N-acetylglucosamine--undecaprenyl-phosphate N-acetylglucosaminephosphotransferase [Pseudoalteromonas citrea]KAF7775475.1 UDP-GlcNAc:undecaprenyl-phosphate GlcNAc-1-phosphate transferase [Pseudoalteromonas citrea]